MHRKNKYTIVLLGAGRLAYSLAPALERAGHNVIQVYSRKIADAKKLSGSLSSSLYTNKLNLVRKDADIYIVAVSDEAIAPLVSEFDPANKIMVHTSGSIPLSVFGRKNTARRGVFYPVQSFTRENRQSFAGIPVCIEAGGAEVLGILSGIGKSIGAGIYRFDSSQRKTLHLAAVFTNNFTTHMLVIAEKILRKKKIPFGILLPLAAETFSRIKNSDPSRMQTGPASRGDRKVISAHLRALAEFPEYRKVYSVLSSSIEKNK